MCLYTIRGDIGYYNLTWFIGNVIGSVPDSASKQTRSFRHFDKNDWLIDWLIIIKNYRALISLNMSFPVESIEEPAVVTKQCTVVRKCHFFPLLRTVVIY